MPTPEAVSSIVTSVTGLVGDLAIFPYVFAGAVFALVGRAIIAMRKAAR